MLQKFRIPGAFALLMASLVLILSGCAATGPKHAEMEQQLATVPPAKGRIFFYRESSMLGAAIQPKIYLNGSPVGESKPGGFFYADVAGGTVEITAQTEASSAISFELREGEVWYVRSAITMGLMVGRIQFTLVHGREARPAMAGLSYTGPVVPANGSSGTGRLPITPPSSDSKGKARSNEAAQDLTLDDLDALLPKAQ